MGTSVFAWGDLVHKKMAPTSYELLLSLLWKWICAPIQSLCFSTKMDTHCQEATSGSGDTLAHARADPSIDCGYQCERLARSSEVKLNKLPSSVSLSASIHLSLPGLSASGLFISLPLFLSVFFCVSAVLAASLTLFFFFFLSVQLLPLSPAVNSRWTRPPLLFVTHSRLITQTPPFLLFALWASFITNAYHQAWAIFSSPSSCRL